MTKKPSQPMPVLALPKLSEGQLDPGKSLKPFVFSCGHCNRGLQVRFLLRVLDCKKLRYGVHRTQAHRVTDGRPPLASLHGVSSR